MKHWFSRLTAVLITGRTRTMQNTDWRGRPRDLASSGALLPHMRIEEAKYATLSLSSCRKGRIANSSLRENECE